MVKKRNKKNSKKIIKHLKKSRKPKAYPEIDLKSDRDIAMDFAVKVYKRFDKMVKAIALFGSSAKDTASSKSDIDIIVLIDDATIVWDQTLIAWYREELAELAKKNQYQKEIHITTVKLTTWWSDLMKGDPTVMNVLRYGEVLVDVGGFFNPIKSLLGQGRIKSTPEAIYLALQRAPEHFRRSKLAELGAIEGLFWAMVDSSQAALMAANVTPPSPEHIPINLKEVFVDQKMLKNDYIKWFDELYTLHKKISHGEVNDLKGVEIDIWQERTENFIDVMARLVNQLIKTEKR